MIFDIRQREFNGYIENILEISFSEDLYEKENDSGNFDYESTYGMKKKFLILCSIFLLIGLLMLLFKFPIIDYFKNKWNEVQSILK